MCVIECHIEHVQFICTHTVKMVDLDNVILFTCLYIHTMAHNNYMYSGPWMVKVVSVEGQVEQWEEL